MKKILRKDSKKGYLLTLGTFMVLIIILALALSLNKTIENSKTRLTILSTTDRIFDLSSSLEKGFREILNAYLDFDVTIQENDKVNVSITERISRQEGEWSKNLEQRLNEFEKFVESQDKNIVVEVDSFDKERPLEIEPYSITYSRSWKIGHVTLNVVPETLNMDGYKVDINTHKQDINSVSSAGIKKGSFKFVVHAIDDSGTNEIENNNIDPGKQNQVIIGLGEEEYVVKVVVNKNELEIWTNTPKEITVTTTIFGLEKLSQKATVVYEDIEYNITFLELGTTKASNIQFF